MKNNADLEAAVLYGDVVFKKRAGVLTERVKTMRLLGLAAVMLTTLGFMGVVPALEGVSDLPMPLMAGGIITAGMIYMLAKVEP